MNPSPESSTGVTATTGDAREPLLSLRDIGKSFSGVPALTGVDLDVYPGSVHALVGENGAGKSTLSKIVAGILTPDTGTIRFAGSDVSFSGAGEARAAGISFVPQELSIVPERTLAENILMGHLPAHGGLVDRRAMGRRCKEILSRLSLHIDPFAVAGSFGPGIQQLVMIARGFSLDAKFFILDEPTAALADAETDHLFEVIEAQRKAGTAFLYISHRLQEIERIADEVTVLRDGKKVFTKPQRSVDHDALIRAMVGRQLTRFFEAATSDEPGALAPVASRAPAVGGDGPPALAVRGLSRGTELHDIDLTVESGTIVGIAGLLGAGRTELLRSIFGIDRPDAGEIEVAGTPVRIRSPRDAIRHGIVLVPEERKSQGLVLNLSVAENIAAPRLPQFAHAGWVSNGKIRAAAVAVKERLGIKTQSVGADVQYLSGGNQQKVVIGRWVLSGADVYLLDEPTRGVDIGAKADIYGVIRELTDQGAAIVVVSSELPELIGLCDRILVMREGRIVDEVPHEEFSEERLLAAAMGHREKVGDR
jgi:ABC-type sugar transport system ATPase subunit